MICAKIAIRCEIPENGHAFLSAVSLPYILIHMSHMHSDTVIIEHDPKKYFGMCAIISTCCKRAEIATPAYR